MAEFLPEIISHLDNANADVRCEAVKALIQIVEMDPETVKSLDNSSIVKVAAFALEKNTELSGAAAAFLTNIVAADVSLASLVDVKATFDVIGDRIKGGSSNTNTFLMYLSNLTIDEAICEKLMSASKYEQHIVFLLEAFLRYNPAIVELEPEMDADHFDQLDRFQHVASLLCNLVRLEAFRKFFLRVEPNYFPRMFNQIASRNLVRRRGAVGCIRTCLFDKDVHAWVIFDMNYLTKLLLPLVGPAPFKDEDRVGMDPVLYSQGDSKSFEAEADVRLMLVECLNLLCQRRVIREELRRRKVYPVIRNLAEGVAEEAEAVSEAIIDLVNLLVRDEDPSTAEEEAAVVA